MHASKLPLSNTPGRILIAEDDRELRRILVETLSKDGHATYEVGDGAALLVELARNSKFHYDAVDLVVADVRMPLCSGMQALETIRRLSMSLPFVLLSAFADGDVHARATQLDAVLLDKPVPMDRLRRVVRQQIERGRAQRAKPSRSSIL